MSVYLIDCDQNGSDSIQHHVDDGRINYVPVPSQETFERVVAGLLPKLGPDDLVILDTISALAETVRWDSKLGSDPADSLINKRSLYLGGDKNFLTVYMWAGDSIMRRMKNIRATGARIITTSHESEQVDETSLTKKRAPQMNTALYSSVMHATSDVFRLYELLDPVLTDEGEVRFAAGTRILQLHKTEESVAKYHVRADMALKIPKAMIVPITGGLHTLYEKLGKRPSWMHLYGAGGVGKTTFCCSEADEKPNITDIKTKEKKAS